MAVSRISPCLWFDTQAEEAARHYCSIFDDTRIIRISHYGDAGREIHGKPPGSVLTVEFELEGLPFTALNGGPRFRFNEAVSLQVTCDTQQQIDRYWNALTAGGDVGAQQCGWLKDRYGLSWQVVPNRIADLLDRSDPRRADRVMTALMAMKKLDIAVLQRAAQG
jgi:predicted 3-demethylubiquinone-9 3-methyltransferase (glyoxalase superfamily)